MKFEFVNKFFFDSYAHAITFVMLMNHTQTSLVYSFRYRYMMGNIYVADVFVRPL